MFALEVGEMASWRRFGMAAILVALVLMVAAIGFGPADAAQTTTSDKAATAGPLMTQVAELQTQIAVLMTDESTPVATKTAISGTKQSSKVVASDGGVDLLYIYTVKDSYKGSDIYGEVKNSNNERVGAPTVRITFFKSGKIVDTQEINAVIGVLMPGEKMPVDGRTDLEKGGWDKTTITLDASASDFATSFYSSDVSIENVNETQKTNAALTVLGEVKNNGKDPVNGVSVYALVYNSKGKYAGKLYGNVNSDTLAPGDSAPFKVDQSYLEYSDGWTYRLVATAYKSS
jgi:hypothetical protein